MIDAAQNFRNAVVAPPIGTHLSNTLSPIQRVSPMIGRPPSFQQRAGESTGSRESLGAPYPGQAAAIVMNRQNSIKLQPFTPVEPKASGDLKNA